LRVVALVVPGDERVHGKELSGRQRSEAAEFVENV